MGDAIVCFGQFLKNDRNSHHFGLLFPKHILCFNFDKKNWLGYILGDFFTNSFGNPGFEPLVAKWNVLLFSCHLSRVFFQTKKILYEEKKSCSPATNTQAEKYSNEGNLMRMECRGNLMFAAKYKLFITSQFHSYIIFKAAILRLACHIRYDWETFCQGCMCVCKPGIDQIPFIFHLSLLSQRRDRLRKCGATLLCRLPSCRPCLQL
jgi:hypothetical protein